jgi:hypothetical protein
VGVICTALRASVRIRQKSNRGSRSGKATRKIAFVLPFVVSLAFLLIADIDAPRHGLIRVSPENLERLAEVAWALMFASRGGPE